jgi:hypothetical protein
MADPEHRESDRRPRGPVPKRTPPRLHRARAAAPSLGCGASRAAALLTTALLLAATSAAAEEQIAMPLGAFECKTIEPVVEHAKIVRAPTTEGLRPFVEAKVASGQCRVVKSEVKVTVTDVDPRGFALVQQSGASDPWWTDAENVWGYFDAPKKVKEWKKP